MTTASLKSAVERFIAKDGKPRKTNVPEHYSSMDRIIRRKIQELQQQIERVEVLHALKLTNPRAALQIQEIILQ